MIALIWKTPVGKVGASPAYKISAGWFPMAMVGGFTAVEKGVAIAKLPSFNCGVIWPRPVPYREMIEPRGAGLVAVLTVPS